MWVARECAPRERCKWFGYSCEHLIIRTLLPMPEVNSSEDEYQQDADVKDVEREVVVGVIGLRQRARRCAPTSTCYAAIQ